MIWGSRLAGSVRIPVNQASQEEQNREVVANAAR